jgi:predicted Zn-dependent protease
MKQVKFSKKLFLFLLCGCFTACQAPKSYTPELSPEEVQSEELNQQLMVDGINARGGQPKAWKNRKNMRKQFETVGERIEKAGAEICVGLHLQKNGCYYYFRLVRDQEINAMSDGKNIVIYTGMMRFVESDDDLAVVMAHEFAHNFMGHQKAQENNATFGKLVGLAADAIADSQGLNTNGEFGKAGTEIGALSYSISFEQEADYIGIYVMARAGYDITKAAKLRRRMSIENPENIYNAVTHPSNAARFVALQKATKEIDYKRKNHIPLLPDFK